jgi:hypothetical protein
MSERGLEGFVAEGRMQVGYFEGRCAAHGRLLLAAIELLERDTAVRDAILSAWATRTFEAVFERPLLLCAAVRFDALRDPAHPLARALADEPDPAEISEERVRASLLRPAAISAMRDRFVQTNEVTRGCAWRVVTGLLPPGDPWAIVDLGCSAGLNLVVDRAGLAWRGKTGEPIPLRDVRVVHRLGLDRAPIDPRDDTRSDVAPCLPVAWADCASAPFRSGAPVCSRGR